MVIQAGDTPQTGDDPADGKRHAGSAGQIPPRGPEAIPQTGRLETTLRTGGPETIPADRKTGINSGNPRTGIGVYSPESTPQAGSVLKDPARSEIQREKHRRNRAWEHLRLHCVSRV